MSVSMGAHHERHLRQGGKGPPELHACRHTSTPTLAYQRARHPSMQVCVGRHMPARRAGRELRTAARQGLTSIKTPTPAAMRCPVRVLARAQTQNHMCTAHTPYACMDTAAAHDLPVVVLFTREGEHAQTPPNQVGIDAGLHPDPIHPSTHGLNCVMDSSSCSLCRTWHASMLALPVADRAHAPRNVFVHPAPGTRRPLMPVCAASSM